MKIIAHRGASVEAPENTLSAFKRALEIGVSCIECDVHMTKDGVIVVSHDEAIPYDSTKSRIARIPTLLYSELSLYDVGLWFHPRFAKEKIPTLREVLSLERKETGLMIELKGGEGRKEEFVRKVLREIEEMGSENLYLGSFDPELVRILQQEKIPGTIQGICSTMDQFYMTFTSSPSHVVMGADYVSKEVIDSFHREKKEVWTYTVDSPAMAKRLAACGVDGIITNDPRALKEVFSKK